MSLNKKQKKQIDVDHKKLEKLRQQLSGAKRQCDDPGEVARLEQEIAAVTAHLQKLQQEEAG